MTSLGPNNGLCLGQGSRTTMFSRARPARYPCPALFDGKSQLFTKTFMLAPGQTRQCVGCSLEVDHMAGLLEHLNNNDVAYAVIAPAPIG